MTWLAALWQPFLIAGRHIRRLDLARGSIDMTDARTLWEQQNLMRAEMMERISILEAKVQELLQTISVLQNEKTQLLVRIVGLESQLRTMEE